jgi:serine/threonine protein kinase
MKYCHEDAIPGCIVLHRDIKPDNIGFTLDGTVKLFDFGLAKVMENASVDSDEVYMMSGETGSLRYMAPEVAEGLPYNHSADVYSFGIILWELNSGKKPFDGLNRESFYERIVHGGERPHLSRKLPQELKDLMSQCWDADMRNRPKFSEITERLQKLLEKEKGGTSSRQRKQFIPKITNMIDRHSTWF